MSAVAAMWFIPDRRIEKKLEESPEAGELENAVEVIQRNAVTQK